MQHTQHTLKAIALAFAITTTGYAQDAMYFQALQWKAERQRLTPQEQVARRNAWVRQQEYQEAILQEEWEAEQEWNALRREIAYEIETARQEVADEIETARQEVQDEIEAIRKEAE